MEFKIDLGYNPIIKLTNEPLVLPVTEPIYLNIGSSTYTDLTIRAIVKCNKKQMQYSVLQNFPIDITNMLSAGVLEITFKSLINGKVAKSWECMPIAVTEVTPDFKLYDLYQSLEKRITALEKAHEIIL